MSFKEIADYLKYLRLKHNYTQQQLSDKVGINRGTLLKIEKGDGNSTLNTIIKIISVFNEQIYRVK